MIFFYCREMSGADKVEPNVIKEVTLLRLSSRVYFENKNSFEIKFGSGVHVI